MISPQERIQDIIALIEENPTDISLDTTTRQVVDGAWKTVKTTKLLKVRIFQQKNTDVTIISDTKGTADTTMKYGMLADYTASIIDNSKENIVFESPYGSMEVTGVYPQIVKGTICGYQCDLKRVS